MSYRIRLIFLCPVRIYWKLKCASVSTRRDSLRPFMNTSRSRCYFTAPSFFLVVDGKPKLHIFANQEAAELKAANDFVGPQPVIGADSKFTGLHYPRERMTVFVKGLARLELKVDATGNSQDLRAVSEEPPLVGLAQAAVTDFTGAKFVPAFRDGDSVESSILLPVHYEPE